MIFGLISGKLFSSFQGSFCPSRWYLEHQALLKKVLYFGLRLHAQPWLSQAPFKWLILPILGMIGLKSSLLKLVLHWRTHPQLLPPPPYFLQPSFSWQQEAHPPQLRQDSLWIPLLQSCSPPTQPHPLFEKISKIFGKLCPQNYRSCDLQRFLNRFKLNYCIYKHL